MVEVSTSILSVEKQDSIKTFYNLEVAHTDYFHIDVMDGKFVERDTSSIMKEYVTELKQITNIPLDVHFMVENIKEYIEEYIDFKPNIITFHIEATNSKQEVLDLIDYLKKHNIRVGISIKPDTDVEQIIDYLPLIHLVLVMSVEPGKGGQKLIPETLEKAKKLKKYITDSKLDVDIQMDGGINLETIENVKQSGIDIVVAGNAIILSDDYRETIKKLKQ